MNAAMPQLYEKNLHALCIPIDQNQEHLLYKKSISMWWAYTLNTDDLLCTLPARAKHVLYRVISEQHCRNLNDLLHITSDDIVRWGPCGKVTLMQIRRVLDKIKEREYSLDMLMYVE